MKEDKRERETKPLMLGGSRLFRQPRIDGWSCFMAVNGVAGRARGERPLLSAG